MANHPRQIIREAVKAKLLAANTKAQGRICDLRATPWRRNELPALAVFTSQEDVDVAYSRNSAPRLLPRTLHLTIEAAVLATDNLANELDALALEVELAVDQDETFGCELVSDTLLASTTCGVSREGQDPVGLVQLTYQITYDTRPSASAGPGIDLKTISAKYSPSGTTHPGNQAEDRVAVQP